MIKHRMGEGEFEGFLIAGNRTVYCPYHGMNGCKCGLWCAMADFKRVDRGLEYFICHAFDVQYLLSPTTGADKGGE